MNTDNSNPTKPVGWQPWLVIVIALAMMVAGVAMLSTSTSSQGTTGQLPVFRFSPTSVPRGTSPTSPTANQGATKLAQANISATPIRPTLQPTIQVAIESPAATLPADTTRTISTLATMQRQTSQPTAQSSVAPPTAPSGPVSPTVRVIGPAIFTPAPSQPTVAPSDTPLILATPVIPRAPTDTHTHTPTPNSVATAQARLTSTAAAAIAAQSSLSAVFETGFYMPIDLERAARDQWGQNATLISGCEHLHCWKATIGRETRSLDLSKAATRQYGPGWSAVAVGAGKNDWRAVKLDDLSYLILPVMLVALDHATDIKSIDTGLARYQSVLANVQHWYYTRVGRTFRLLQPLVVFTDCPSAEWHQIAQSTTREGKGAALGYEALEHYGKRLPQPPATLRVIMSPYTGDSSHVWQGAVAINNHFAVVPPRTTSLTCPLTGPLNRECANAAYAAGQVLGYLFGLDNSCSSYPTDSQCRSSIMQGATPPDAILLPGEIDRLKQVPFFSRY